jgi:NADH-quinone oxidoreductase subunit C
VSTEDLLAGLAAAAGLDVGEVVASDADGTLCVDVPVGAWTASLTHARDAWGCFYFDWLSAVDQTDVAESPGIEVVAHVAALPSSGDPVVRHVLIRTRVPSSDLTLGSATGVYAGAAWHERETHEMFGVDFAGFDDGSGYGMRPLLLPDGFEGTPLRKEFQLASRAAKPWPGAKEPGESHADQAAPSRRKLLPPGVPDQATWGPRRAAAPAQSAPSAAAATESADVVGEEGQRRA